MTPASNAAKLSLAWMREHCGNEVEQKRRNAAPLLNIMTAKKKGKKVKQRKWLENRVQNWVMLEELMNRYEEMLPFNDVPKTDLTKVKNIIYCTERNNAVADRH